MQRTIWAFFVSVFVLTCLPLTLTSVRADAKASSYCDRIGWRKYDFCGEYSYGFPSGSLEIRGLPGTWNRTKRRTEYRMSATRSLRVAVSGACCMSLRVWGNKRSWLFTSTSGVKSVKIPRGTYSICFNDFINNCGSNSWHMGVSWFYYNVPDSELLSRYGKANILIVY
jgi:hypothetical protein